MNRKLFFSLFMAFVIGPVLVLQACTPAPKLFVCNTPAGPVIAPNPDFKLNAWRDGQYVHLTGPGFRDVIPFNDCIERTIVKE